MKTLHHFILLAALLCYCAMPAMAQQEMVPLPMDPQLRYGKLDNGLTYYIRHNALPKERADFYIVQNVGSILEEDNQRGLAHFLEHMAFHGSKHFPGNGIIDYTERVGMRFGENLNASTGFDKTVYTLKDAPVNKPGVTDSCLLILHDWSNAILLTDSLIDKERGVIREEWRSRQGAQMRMMEQQLPRMYAGSRYADRLPIGKMEIVENFKPAELEAYYRKWYRPDLQAVVIVGDIDVDQVEATVRKLFSDIPAPTHPAERVYYPVPDNAEPLVSIATDKESSNTILYLFNKYDKMPKDMYATAAGFVYDYMQSAAATMLNERLDELVQKGNPPFVYGASEGGDYYISSTKGAWTTLALVKENHIKEAMNALVTEINRARQFGFTASEYERARTNILKGYESAYNERENQRNSSYTSEYANHFSDGGYTPGIEMEYTMINQIAPAIPVEQINQLFQKLVTDKNIVISLMAPEKEGLALPTEAELLAMYREAGKIPVEAYQESVSDEPLIPALPAPGKIVESKVDPLFGATVMTLGNGARVVLKHTDFKKDEIRMTAASPGGTSLFSNADSSNLKVMNSVVGLGGLGNFSAVDLNKALAGKDVSCAVSVGQDRESVSGQAVPADIRTLFELIYLHFTAPRTDNEAYASFINRMKAQLKNYDLNPAVAFSDTITRAAYNDNPRTRRLYIDEMDRIDYARILEMYKERFADASDFVFTFVGNLDIEAMKPLIEQYIATLPALKHTEKVNLANVPKLRTGLYNNVFKREMETPKASVLNLYSGKVDYNLENQTLAAFLSQILDIVYTEKVRQEEGGTYGVQSAAVVAEYPEGQAILQIYFDTDPDKWERMAGIVQQELHKIAQEGPREADFNKTKDNLKKRFDEQLQENAYWLGTLNQYYFRHVDTHTPYPQILDAITPGKVKDFTKALLDQGNCIKVVMKGER